MADSKERGSDFTKAIFARDERLRGHVVKAATDDRLTKTDLRVLLLLIVDGPLRRYNKTEARYFRSQIKDALGISEESVSRSLTRLETCGLISRESNTGPHGNVLVRVLLPIAGDASIRNFAPFQPWLKDTPISDDPVTNGRGVPFDVDPISDDPVTNPGPVDDEPVTDIRDGAVTHNRGEIPYPSGERNTFRGVGGHDALEGSTPPAGSGSSTTRTESAHDAEVTNDEPVVTLGGNDGYEDGSVRDDEADTERVWEEPDPVVRMPGDATAERAVEIFADSLGKPLSAATRKRLVASLGEVQPSTTLLEMLMGLGFWHEYRDGRFPQDAAERVEQAMALDSGDIDMVNCLTALGAVKEGRDRARWHRMSPAERKDFVLSPAFWATGPSSDGPGSEIVNVRGIRRKPIFTLDDAFGAPRTQFHAAWTGRSQREPVMIDAEVVSPAPF